MTEFSEQNEQNEQRTEKALRPTYCIDQALASVEDASRQRSLESLKENIEKFHIGEKERTYLDSLAVALFSDGPLPEDKDEMVAKLTVVTKALEGDEQATRYLTGLLTNRRDFEDELSTVDQEALELAVGHVLVRGTNNKPDFYLDGSVAVRSAAEHSVHAETFVPRGTVHFSIDHQAQAHLFGHEFATARYTIVAPLDRTLEENRRPVNMKSVDTFFATGPGEAVTLPDAVVLTDSPEQDELLIKKGQSAYVKSGNFHTDDINAVIDQFSKQYGYHELEAQLKRQGLVDRSSVHHWDAVEGLLAQVAPGRLDATLGAANHALALRTVIKRFKAQVAVSDGQSSYVHGLDRELVDIAQRLHVPFGLHVDTPYNRLEDTALAFDAGKTDDYESNLLLRLISETDPATQRLYLLHGYATFPRKAQFDPNADTGV